MGRAKIRDAIQRIEAYVPGLSSHDVGRAVVKLSSNENPYGPPPKAVEALRRAAPTVNRYPDKEARRLRARLSERLNIPVDSIAVGNGSDDLLEHFAQLFISEGDNLVTHSAFSTYNTVASSMGGKRRLVPDHPGMGIDVEGLMQSCDERTKILLVCTPNNPTGAILNQDELERLLDFTMDRGIFLVLDEAYSEFSERYVSPARRIVEEDLDAAVTRTFSKAYGLAGVRLGYGIAPAHIIHYLDLVRMPFNASSLAQEAALAALDDEDYVRGSVQRIRRGRAFLAEGLSSLGLSPLPSEANFILVDVGVAGLTARGFTEGLLERGFAVRDCTGFGLPNHVRISVGNEEQNSSLLRAVGSLLTSG